MKNTVTVTFNLSKDFIEKMDEVNIPKEKRAELFTNWVRSAIGEDYGTSFVQFDNWMEESDNYIDFVEDSEE